MKLTKEQLSWKEPVDLQLMYHCNVCGKKLELNIEKKRLVCSCGFYFSIIKEPGYYYYASATKPERMSLDDFNLIYKQPVLNVLQKVASACFQRLENFRETWDGNIWTFEVDGVFV